MDNHMDRPLARAGQGEESLIQLLLKFFLGKTCLGQGDKSTNILLSHKRGKRGTVYILADSGFFKNFLYEGGVKSTVSWVFEDLKFKISEGYDQNWCFPDSAQLAVSVKLRQLTGQSQATTNFGRSLLKF